MRPELDIKPHLGAPHLTFIPGYIMKSILQRDTSAKQRRFEISFPSPMRAAKGHRASPAHLQVIALAIRSKQVVFTYDQVVKPHHSYRPSGGLQRGMTRTGHRWNCLQLSNVRGVDNGGVRSTTYIKQMTTF